MTEAERRENARKFYNKWKDRGQEKQECQLYWIDFLINIVGIENATERIDFEKNVLVNRKSKHIDAYIKETHVLIEQKSKGLELDKKYRNSDGLDLTPYEQAKRYNDNLPYEEKAKWIITSNFYEIWVYDMNDYDPKPEKFSLEQIPKIYNKFDFIIDKKQKSIKQEEDVSFKAGEFVGLIYNALAKEYKDLTKIESQESLNILCVRLVFCLYAEDAFLFGTSGHMFHDYLEKYETNEMRKALKDLFSILNTPEEKRDYYDKSLLSEFPYVNGGLFEKEDIEIPNFTDEIREILLKKASEGFDWSCISPTIFGAVFESTLNPETRRKGGMHYTTVEDIHKVIDNLFLDDIKEEFEEIKKLKVPATKKNRLIDFQIKLSKLIWLDPAAGSGNFLTETYLSIRKIENEIIKETLACEKFGSRNQLMLGNEASPILVNISQFYGIEINDFAVTVAKTALWIAESQMMKETEEILNQNIKFLPLKTNANIVENNALTIDWNTIVSNKKTTYILGNPPFVGGMYMSEKQKKDVHNIFPNVKGAGEFDYVCCWYKKALDYISGTNIKVAFVSTNSICQGEQVINFWKYLFDKYPLFINYAFTTFEWDSQANVKAKVHCIIVGFSSCNDNKMKKIIDSAGNEIKCKNINAYLMDGDNFFVESRSVPLWDVPKMRFGSMPRDGGGFVLTPDERIELIKKEPLTEKWIKKYLGADEFLNNKERYCLWLVGANPEEIAKCPTVMKRIEKVRETRLASKAEGTRKFAETPTVFCQIAQPESNYIIVPKTSSKNRDYIPLGFQDKNTIASDLVFLIPNAGLYEFGVLMSNVHNAWMRLLAGRLKSDYRYAKDIVYNNFPWPNPNKTQREKIEKTAQKILEVRKKYKDSTLAEMYHKDKMYLYIDLLHAHQENDRAVMEAYGLSISDTSEQKAVDKLMKLYQRKISKNY